MTTTEITAPVAAPGVAEVLAPAVEESESIAAGVRRPAKRGPRLVRADAGQALRSTAWFLVGGATVIALWQIVAALADGLPTPLEAAGSLASFVGDPFYDRGTDKGIGFCSPSRSNGLRRIRPGRPGWRPRRRAARRKPRGMAGVQTRSCRSCDRCHRWRSSPSGRSS
jgi:hypothetical protein